MKSFKITLAFVFLLLGTFSSYAQTTQTFKSYDKTTDKTNILTVTNYDDGSISILRSAEEPDEITEVTAYNLAILNSTMDYYWIVPFRDGEAEKASGVITLDCNCSTKSGEKEGIETFNIFSGKMTCQNACSNDIMLLEIDSKIYQNTGGYLIIEATSITFE